MVPALDEPIACDSCQRNGQEEERDIDPKGYQETHV